MAGKIWSIDEAAAYIQSHNLFLHFDERLGVDLWTPHQKTPMKIRRAVYKHRQEIAARMRAGDSLMCPARNYHRPFFRHVGAGRFVCDKCIELDAAIHGTGGQELAS